MLLEPPRQGRDVICSMLKLGDSPIMLPAAAGRAGKQKLQLTACWGELCPPCNLWLCRKAVS